MGLNNVRTDGNGSWVSTAIPQLKLRPKHRFNIFID